MFGRTEKIQMFVRIPVEFKCFLKDKNNSNVWKDKKRTLIFKRMGEKFQCLKGEEKNYIL